MLALKSQTTYRGFVIPRELLKKYYKGRCFFWQAFVSTSKDRETALNFAKECEKSGDNVPIIFTIDIPEYSLYFPWFYAYDMEPITAFKGEAEVLLMPYTRFQVVKDPKMVNGIFFVHIKALNVQFAKSIEDVTVWVDPNGFAKSNFKLAKTAWLAGMPRFNGSDDACIPDSIMAVGLFITPGKALSWMKEQTKHAGCIFKIIVSGQSSRDLLDRYFAEDTSSPCKILVYCGHVEKWKKVWKNVPHIRVTNKPSVLIAFFQKQSYKSIRNTWENILLNTKKFYKGVKISYPWMIIEDGASVVYGGVMANSTYFEKPWKRSSGVIGEDIRMFPFEKDRSIAAVDIFKELANIPHNALTPVVGSYKVVSSVAQNSSDEKDEKSQPSCESEFCKVS